MEAEGGEVRVLGLREGMQLAGTGTGERAVGAGARRHRQAWAEGEIGAMQVWADW